MAKNNQLLASKIAEKKSAAPAESGAPAIIAPKKTLEASLEERNNQFREALSGSGMSWDRFKRILITEVSQDEDLRYAAGVNPTSLLISALEIASLGLDPSIPNECYLIPRNIHSDDPRKIPEVTTMTGYKGLEKLAIEAARETGVPLTVLRAEMVCERDVYEREMGDSPRVVHRAPPFGQDRGKVLGYYAVSRDTAGRVNFHEMTVSAVQRHKERFSKVRRGPFADPENFDAFGLKTVMRMLCNRYLAMGPKLARALSLENDSEADAPRRESTLVSSILAPIPEPEIRKPAPPAELEHKEPAPATLTNSQFKEEVRAIVEKNLATIEEDKAAKAQVGFNKMTTNGVEIIPSKEGLTEDDLMARVNGEVPAKPETLPPPETAPIIAKTATEKTSPAVEPEKPKQLSTFDAIKERAKRMKEEMEKKNAESKAD